MHRQPPLTMTLLVAWCTASCGATATQSEPPSQSEVSSRAADTADTTANTADSSSGRTDALQRGDSDLVSPDAGPSAPWTQAVADGPWEWVAAHDGTGIGSHTYSEATSPEVSCTADEECETQFCHQGLGVCRQLLTPNAYYEYARFELFQPFQIRTLRVQVDVSQSTTLSVHVWDDLGGDGCHIGGGGAEFESADYPPGNEREQEHNARV